MRQRTTIKLVFILIFGVGGISIVTLVFQIQFMITINKMATNTKDETLEKIFYFQIGGLIAPFVGLSIVTIILNILTFVELKEWFSRTADANNHPRLVPLEEQIDLIKLGHILSFIFVGVFIIPLGYRRTGDEILREHGRTQFNWIQTYPGRRIYPQSNTYGAPQSNSTRSTYDSPTYTNAQSPKFCISCGASVPNTNAQFCELCGEKL